MTKSHLVRALDAASYTDHLLTDLVRVTDQLACYRNSPGGEMLRERSYSAQGQLKAISEHLEALGLSADPGKYPLSDAEHIVLERACDLRERLVESLSRYQRADKKNINR
jgi:hypothetical protein